MKIIPAGIFVCAEHGTIYKLNHDGTAAWAK